ncbi:MAG: carbohydrate-binding domain-containing protein [Candidatus Omnitrophica bacterium]|nr:carbohydrate-binding domain-containing protein [Candidatus Omnitrophota bacterium]MDD5437411.1 carbohydrate-binding domain-containing protein [Candidatus Omnitrophota bacterium]
MDDKKMNALRRISINLILIAAFAAISFAILVPLFAEVQFYSAEKLITKYLWKDAEEKLLLAIKTDPINSKYPARLGEFLFTQSAYKDDPAPLLKKAEEYYRRAAALNPRRADYFTKLGRIKLALFLEDPSGKKLIKDAFGYFKKAAANDPNGFNAAYEAGYSGLAVWKYLNEDEKALVVGRLKCSLENKPWYSEYIYSQVLRMTEDPELLELIIPEIEAKRWVSLEKVGKLKSDTPQAKVTGMILRRDWQGTALGSSDVYENGNMYWTGTVYGAMLFPKGDAQIEIEAKGNPAGGIYPYMLISLDGKKIGSAYVDSAEFKKYSFNADTEGGVKILGVTFTNDGGSKKEDRNLYVGNAQVEQI